MIIGVHVVLYSTDAAADRAFFSDVLGFDSVDAGGGWLIIGLPSSELAVHPGDGSFKQAQGDRDHAGLVLYLMTDDVRAEAESLASKGVECSSVTEADWGAFVSVRLPSGAHIGMYQPAHETAI